MTRALELNDSATEAEAEQALAGSLETHLGYQLRRASAVVLSRLASSLSDLNLKITEASVLLMVDEHPDITQSALGRMLAIHRANMAPLAALLTERGLIERSRSEGRAQGLKTTSAGHDLALRVRQRMDAQEARVLPELSPDERSVLIGLLSRVWRG